MFLERANILLECERKWPIIVRRLTEICSAPKACALLCGNLHDSDNVTLYERRRRPPSVGEHARWAGEVAGDGVAAGRRDDEGPRGRLHVHRRERTWRRQGQRATQGRHRTRSVGLWRHCRCQLIVTSVWRYLKRI